MEGNKVNKASSSIKWEYIQGRALDLPPLDLDAIRRQLQDDSSEESEDEGDAVDSVLNESFCEDVTAQCSANNFSECQSDGPGLSLNVLSPIVEEPNNLYKSGSDCGTNIENNEKVPAMDVPICSDIKEDSFIFNFSLLDLKTPLKQPEVKVNLVTPRINIIPLSESKCLSVAKTPNVGNRRNIGQPLFKTPIHKPLTPATYSLKKPNKVNGAPFFTSSSVDVNGGDPVIKPMVYMAEDGHNRICVNGVEYVVIHFLGKGGSSEVFCCIRPDETTEVAIKLVTLSDSEELSSSGYINEVELLRSLQNCDRIIKMFDYQICDDRLAVVLEKGDIDLSAILKKRALTKSHMPSYELIFYWMEMLYAVKQIHDNGVIHSDLKPSNFIRVGERLKLIDFGIASKVQGDMTCVIKANQEGSCNYISPEALKHQSSCSVSSPNYGSTKYKLHFKSDVWSLGCILYQLVYGTTPFHHISSMWTKFAAITDPNYEIAFPNANWAPEKIIDTTKKCLQYEVKTRPSVAELIQEYEHLLKNI